MNLSDDDSSRSSTSSKSKSNKSRNNGRSQTSKSKAAKSVANQEQIEQFCAVTGSTEDVARNLIEACNGNLEMAVNMHIEGGMSGTSAAEAAEDYVRAPIPQKQEILVQSGYEGYGFSHKGKRRMIKSVFDSFRNFEVETKLQESRLIMERNGQAASTSDSGTSGRRTLEDLFRPPIDLMFKGNLQEARDVGSQTHKWLMVNIQNVSEFPCQVLNRDVWSSRSVKELIRENFIFLQVYMDSEEGQRYMTFYKVNQWPYVAVLDPRTGELMAEWSQTDPPTYIELISDFLACNPWEDDFTQSKPPGAKKRKMETILDASEDDQLQAAIRASLQASELRPASSEEENDNEEESESGSAADWFDSESESRTLEPPVVEEKDSSEQKQNQNDENDWKQHLGSESDPMSSIIFRYPDGTKEQFSLPCSSTIQAVLKYVDSKGFPPDKYELMANFPKRLLLSMDVSTTLKEAGLFPQDTVFVQSR